MQFICIYVSNWLLQPDAFFTRSGGEESEKCVEIFR